MRLLALLGAVVTAGCASPGGVERRGWQNVPGTAELVAGARPEHAELALSPQPAPSARSRPTIEFHEFYTYGSRAPRPRPKLLRLNGKRITLVGYMAQMRSPPRGGFYLAPYPAVCGESRMRCGGLPPPSVLVLPHAARGRQVAFVEGTFDVTGILDTDQEGRVVRLILDDLKGFRLANNRSSAR